ncbi:ATP-binding protein [Desulfonauticus submarinus]
MSLKLKIILLFWSIIFITLFLPSTYFLDLLEQEIQRDVIYNVKKEINSVLFILEKYDFKKDRESLDTFIKKIGKVIQDRITYITEDGIVIADSVVDKKKIKQLDNHASRPEIVQARTKKEGMSIRFSGTIHKKLIYYAIKINSSHGLPKGYLRIARPYSTVAMLLGRIKKNMWGIAIALLLLSGLLVYLFGCIFFKRFNRFVTVTRAIGQGDFSKRIYTSPAKEFEPLVDAVNEMAKNIEQYVATISKQKIEVEAILNGIDAGVVALDKQGKVVQYNKAFEQIFSEMKEYIGKTLLEITINTNLHQACQKALQEKISIKNLEICIDKDFYNVNIIVIKKATDLGAIVVFHNISELKRVENMRKDFIANASHELRTPLTSIRGYTETLLDNDGILKDKGKEILRVILRNAEQMNCLLDDILKLSRLESGKEEFIFEKINLYKIVEKSWKSVKHLIKQKDIKFVNMIDKEIELISDRESLLHVFQNLIHNSIKFVPDKNAQIKAIFKQYKHEIWLGIWDNGPGIPLDEQDRIFERFYQVKKYVAKGIKGTGLGLSICRHLVHNLGGRIWVESPIKEVGYGCIVWFSLPKRNN